MAVRIDFNLKIPHIINHPTKFFSLIYNATENKWPNFEASGIFCK
jgi:hypothetical protein